MKRAIAVVLALVALSFSRELLRARAGSPDSPPPAITFPSQRSTPLQLEITIDGRAPLADWQRFLDELFDHFDQSSDGSLSPAEAKRMFPLPLLTGKHIAVDFVKMDADRSGGASRQEFRAYCLAAGFGPVGVAVAAPAAADLRVGAWWSKVAAAAGNDFLREFDLDEDEHLDLAELALAAEKFGVPKEALEPASVARPLAGAASLRIDLDAKTSAVELSSAKNMRLVRSAAAYGLHRLDGDGWSAVFRATRLMPDVRSAREFLVAQFETALGERDAVKKEDIDDDALRDLFDFADRDGNGQLGMAELTSYLKLIEKGVRAQTLIQVIDRGRNPFHRLDTDGDRRLNLHELSGMKSLGKPPLPRQFEIAFVGPAGVRWGGVLIRGAKSGAAPRTAGESGPRWFDAMDRNRDGYLSSREFLGPPGRYRQLDADADGLVSREEARKSEGSR